MATITLFPVDLVTNIACSTTILGSSRSTQRTEVVHASRRESNSLAAFSGRNFTGAPGGNEILKDSVHRGGLYFSYTKTKKSGIVSCRAFDFGHHGSSTELEPGCSASSTSSSGESDPNTPISGNTSYRKGGNGAVAISNPVIRSKPSRPLTLDGSDETNGSTSNGKWEAAGGPALSDSLIRSKPPRPGGGVETYGDNNGRRIPTGLSSSLSIREQGTRGVEAPSSSAAAQGTQHNEQKVVFDRVSAHGQRLWRRDASKDRPTESIAVAEDDINKNKSSVSRNVWSREGKSKKPRASLASLRKKNSQEFVELLEALEERGSRGAAGVHGAGVEMLERVGTLGQRERSALVQALCKRRESQLALEVSRWLLSQPPPPSPGTPGEGKGSSSGGPRVPRLEEGEREQKEGQQGGVQEESAAGRPPPEAAPSSGAALDSSSLSTSSSPQSVAADAGALVHAGTPAGSWEPRTNEPAGRGSVPFEGDESVAGAGVGAVPGAAAGAGIVAGAATCQAMDDATMAQLISAVSRDQGLAAAEDFVSGLPQRRRSLGVASQNALLCAGARWGRPAKVLALAEALARDSCPLTAYSCTAVIAALDRGGEGLPAILRVWEAFLRQQGAGGEPDAVAYTAMVVACAHAAETGLAESFFEEMQRPPPPLLPATTPTASTTAAWAAGTVRNDSAGRRREGLKPNVVTYNALMLAYGRAGQVGPAEHLLEGMRRAGVAPTLRTFTGLLMAYCKQGREDQGEALLARLREAHLAPDAIFFGAWEHAYAERGDHIGVELVLARMRQLGVERDAGSWNIFAAALRNADRAGSSLGVDRVMQRDGVDPDLRHYNLKIHTLACSGKPQQAIELFEDLPELGLVPDAATYNALLTAHAAAGDLHTTTVVIKQMERAGLPPDVATFTTLIDAYGRAGRLRAAIHTYRWMRGRGIMPSAATYAALVGAYGRRGSFREAHETLAGMRAADLRGRQLAPAFDALANAYARHGRAEEAVGVVEAVREEGLPVTLRLFNTLINAFAEGALPRQALLLLDAIRQQGLQPDVISYTAVMKAHLAGGILNRVPEIYDEMVSCNIKPDAMANSLLRCAQVYSKSKRLPPLYLKAKAQGRLKSFSSTGVAR